MTKWVRSGVRPRRTQLFLSRFLRQISRKQQKGNGPPRLHLPLVLRGESTEKANSDYEHRAAACWRGPPFHRAAFGFAAQVFDSRTQFRASRRSASACGRMRTRHFTSLLLLQARFDFFPARASVAVAGIIFQFVVEHFFPSSLGLARPLKSSSSPICQIQSRISRSSTESSFGSCSKISVLLMPKV